MGRVIQHRRSRTTAVVRPVVRCAIYTRKSTDEGLDQDFNSLDAQREIAEAYITSQRTDGWLALPERYDDGGYTGANTNRPALQRLLADIEAGKVDQVVVYRYDRVSRSLLDFLQLLEFLKRHEVGFVSVSERFDTSTPHGEMALNMVLSVAQCERKVIGQRTKDKMQAARRRGKWTGGMPPLGYDVMLEGGRLVVNKAEAEQVRAIFQLYVETPSLVKVCEELARRGWRTKSWTTKTGTRREGSAWNRVTLRRLLRNPVVVGRISLGDEVFPAEHDAIVPKKLYDEVQRLMEKNRATSGAPRRNRHGALLRGLLRCAACDSAMTFVPTRRGTKLYRYYRCVAAQKHGAASCPTGSLSADKIEAFIVGEIRRIGADPELQRETFRQAVAQVRAQRRGLKMEKRRLEGELATARQAIERLVRAITDTEGAARDAIVRELEKAQGHVAALEARLGEIQAELAGLDPAAVDEAELARALEAFDPIWDVLLTPEKERVLSLLIERIDYDGRTGELKIHWRLAGLGQFAAEVNGGGA